MDPSERLLAFDGNNLAMRAVMVMDGKPLASMGQNTGPLLVFIRMLSKYVRRYPSSHVVVCWDGGYDQRTALYPDYKGNRKEKGDGVMDIFTLMKEFLSLANIHHVRVDGYEADDLLGHYWRGASSMVIVSADKDLLQLVSSDVMQVRPLATASNPSDEEWTVERMIETHGCAPEHWGKVLALTGDKGDNIPGLDRVGVKTAVKHLEQCEWSLPALLDHPPAVFEKTPDYRDVVERNFDLVDLRSPPSGLSLPEPPLFHPTSPNSATWLPLIDWLRNLRMESILAEVEQNTLWRD